ncbi:MAG: glycosyltransferase family 39 protein [bacterium]|nr:glycosyltransferase family 39 protein [bacterium]
MPYWIQETLAGTPAFLFVYVVVGGVWALAVLPRRDWYRRVEVAALAFALGPMLLTLWMFILGTIGGAAQMPLLRSDLILFGLVIVTVIGALIVWRKRTSLTPSAFIAAPLAWDERLLIGLIAVALVVRWVIIAYWPFTAYDALWVYGYQGRLYFLEGWIRPSIGYYPQFVPLQYAFAQIMTGMLNDHVARAGVFLLHLGSILAAHTLGARLFNRRVGIMLAAIWTLYPHTGEWSRAGDLEIPLAFLFTLAAAYFLIAWRGDVPRRHYALIAGVVFGIGLWTKPTMGAFVWGMGLLSLIALAAAWRVSSGSVQERLHRVWAALCPRIGVVLLTGFAAVPVGGIWYVRNLLLGHAVVDFPPSYWLGLALRSGGELGWWLVALVLLLLFIMFGVRRRPAVLPLLIGALLITAGVLPSITEPRRMMGLEWLAFGVGVGSLTVVLLRQARRAADAQTWTLLRQTAAALIFALPYFVTWFYSYSYHYRLSFAVVPLLITPSAVILAHWLNPAALKRAHPLRRRLVTALLIAVSIPGMVSAIYDLNGGWDYLQTDRYPTDDARVRSGNAALMQVVDGLNIWKHDNPGQPLIVDAPGIDRLPFFFPVDTIRTADPPPTRLSQIEDAAYFVWGAPETIGAYQAIQAPQNQVLGALGRVDLGRLAWWADDGIFRYDVYEIDAARRFEPKLFQGVPPADVVIGGFTRFLGYDLGGLEIWPGRPLYLTLYWEVLAQAQADYSIFIHLRDAEGRLLATWDGPVAQSALGYYATQFWEPGEIIRDERVLRLPEGVNPVGQGLQFWIGIYEPVSQVRLPVTADGASVASRDVLVDDRITGLERAPDS